MHHNQRCGGRHRGRLRELDSVLARRARPNYQRGERRRDGGTDGDPSNSPRSVGVSLRMRWLTFLMGGTLVSFEKLVLLAVDKAQRGFVFCQEQEKEE